MVIVNLSKNSIVIIIIGVTPKVRYYLNIESFPMLQIEIGMDVAASEFFKNGTYDLDFKNPKSNPADYLSSDKLADVYLDFIKDFPMVSIEDPFDQDDWSAWSTFTGKTSIQIVGDDLTVRMHNIYILLGIFLASVEDIEDVCIPWCC